MARVPNWAAKVMAFIHPDFLLQSEAARHLFHEFAEGEPILDFHSHLSPRDIAENRSFANLSEAWLGGDHYKWRAMRANGVEERLCTGDAPPYEKFTAWAATVPRTLRNPLFHWTHLELERHFGIGELLNETTAPRIWDAANERLKSPEMSVHGLLKRFDARALCTTDDPADSLEHHEAIKKSAAPTRVFPTFRPDKCLNVHHPDEWNGWLDKLGATTNRDIVSLDDLLGALEKRHDDFHAIGARLSDHSVPQLPDDYATHEEARAIFERARTGVAASPDEQARFVGFLMEFFGGLNARKGWTQQLHLGAVRNPNSRALEKVGADAGFDTVGDWPQVANLTRYLDRLESRGALPKTVIYNLNPRDTFALAALCGSFPGEGVRGKIQYGAAWWFLDQKDGIEAQLNALSNTGLLANFIGMLTDSRSFLSFPRHEYFRRILCNLCGREMELGELPNDLGMVGALIRAVCFSNARDFLALPIN